MTISTDLDNVAMPCQQELERIKAFKLPDFVPPYPYKRNKFGDNATAEAYRWMEEYSMHKGCENPEGVLQAIYKADVPVFTMGAYVDCGEKEAAWVTEYFIWLFVFDDRLDDITNFCSPEKSTELYLGLHVILMWSFPDDERLYEKFLNFLDVGEVSERSQALDYLQSKLDQARLKPGTVYDTSSPEVHPLCKGFRDLWAQLCQTMPADFLRRWGLLFQDQLLANLTEIRNRRYKTIPSVDDYIACRRDSVAMRTCSVVIEFVDKVHLPDKVFYCSEMQRFLHALNDFISWHNDLWSFEKEALIGDVHNFVIVVSHAENCSYAEAGTKVYQMMLEKIEEMEKVILDLENVTPPAYQHAISRYSNMGRNYVTSTHHWHANSRRYARCL